MANGAPFSLSFRDAKNQVASLRGYQDSPADVATNTVIFLPNFQAVSNAHVTWPGGVATAPVAGTAAVYGNVEDKAVFVFQDAAGSLHKYQVPAPIAAIFQADGETIDYANAAVGTLVTAFLSNFVTREGIALSASVGGYRRRSPAQRRFSIRTRNPALTGQGL